VVDALERSSSRRVELELLGEHEAHAGARVAREALEAPAREALLGRVHSVGSER
jgi:hypothetical protein